jgi:hypothetical protein
MKQSLKKSLLITVAAATLTLGLAGCGGTKTPTSSASSSAAPVSSSVDTSSSEPAAPTIYDQAKEHSNGTDLANVKGVTGGTTGVSSFVSENVATKTKILGALEKYAVDKAIAGLPLYENGSYVMYNNRVVKGVSNYITGYGFGILREGSLNGTLTGPTGKIKPTYYHNWDQSDPATINALNDSGSQVADLYGNMAATYFGNKKGATGTSYDWYGTLSNKDRPWIVKDGVASEAADGNVTSDTWRVYLRTGDTGGVEFRTGSTKDDRKAYDHKKVTIDDYVNAWKILLCGKFAYYRGTELISKTGKNGFKGIKDYYNASKDGFGSTKAEAAWKDVGIVKGNDAKNGDYIDFTFLAPTNRFYAMYLLSEPNYAPINLDFFKLVTDNYANPGNYGSYNSDKSMTPVDNILSTGAYYLESWEDSKAISFKRNETWKEYDWTTGKEYTGIYSIPGIYTQIISAYTTDDSAPFKEFNVGNLDAAGIPQEYFDAFHADPRAVQVPGDSVFKLNVNSTTKAQWNKLFGTHGTVAQTKDDSYAVKPWMSNDLFVKGLFYSIDRETFAASRGVIPSINYFSSNYLSDPEGGVSYNTTAEHTAALTDFWGATTASSGFSLSLAQAAFNKAIDAMATAGTLPTDGKLTIDVWWMAASQKKTAEEIAGYIQDAFNGSSEAKAKSLTLTVNNNYVTVWSDVYYKHLMVGQFDLGFGSITGNALDPLNFMEVLKSNNSSGFTLNWGPDTSAIDLDYNGTKWSFDNLWAAADHGVVTYKGQEVKAVSVLDGAALSFDKDNNLTVTVKYTDAKSYMKKLGATDADAKTIGDLADTEYSVSLDDFYITDQDSAYVTIAQGTDGTWASDNAGVTVVSVADGVATFTISQDLLGGFGDAVGAFMIGADATMNIEGIKTSVSDQVTYLLGSSAA